jgi:hypothetical protein
MKKVSNFFLISMTILLLISVAFSVVACATPADVASRNLSKEADNFQVTRRITFINGITNESLLVIEGLCSLGNNDAPGSLSVTCKTGENEYKKHYLGLSDNVTYISEQIDSTYASRFHYKVLFNPSTIIPDIELVQ